MATNPKYLTATVDADRYNGFFSFALGTLASVPAYTSATLTLKTGVSAGAAPFALRVSAGAAPFALRLSDVGATLVDLDQESARGNVAGQALFTDLGSGISCGDFAVNTSTLWGQTFAINLNQTFLNPVNSGLLTNFSIGGTLNLTQAVIAAVLEPGT